MEEEKKSFGIDFGGLWRRQTKKGIVFYSGPFGRGGTISIWPNKKREGKNDPDLTIRINEYVPKDKDVEVNKDPFAPMATDASLPPSGVPPIADFPPANSAPAPKDEIPF
jgi:hypothetical protein